jgi:hypothetical protein
MKVELSIGCRVMRKGWERYPDWLHLARLGTVVHPGWALVTVRWDAPPGGAEKTERVHCKELSWVWWRST